MIHDSELISLSSLRGHPQNYKKHPKDQLDHLVAAIQQYGVFRNVVVSVDGVILAGHGVVEGGGLAGMTEIRAVRMPFEHTDIRALKLLALDNEVSHLGEVDDRQLSEILKKVLEQEEDQGLLGTGYDAEMLAALTYVTRPASEVEDMDEAKEWSGAGMPSYDPAGKRFQVLITCSSEEHRSDLMAFLGAEKLRHTQGKVVSLTWPIKNERDDWKNIRVE